MERTRRAHILPVRLGLAGLALIAGLAAPASSAAQSEGLSPRCEELMARYTLHPDSFTVAPAQVSRFVIGPTEWPMGFRADTIVVHLLVDLEGGVVRDSTWFTPGVDDRRFARRLRESAARYRFQAATIEGCPLASWASIHLLRPRRG